MLNFKNYAMTTTQDSQKDAILELLHLQKHMKRSELLHALIGKGFVMSDRDMRLTIEHMIKDDHYCIQSSEKGYSLITTLEDLEKAKSYLEKKAASIAVRKNCLERNFREQKLKPQL